MIPPPAQRFMSERAGSTVVEVAGSHAIYVSQPNVVAKLIKTAAEGVTKTAISSPAALANNIDHIIKSPPLMSRDVPVM